MPQVPIIMPQLGESIAEATIVSYLVQPGDDVAADQDIIEVETNKATMNVVSPARGRLGNFTAKLNESYAVGAVLGQIEITAEEAARLGLDTIQMNRAQAENAVAASAPNGRSGEARVEPTIRGLPRRRTRSARAIFRRGSRPGCTNSGCTRRTWRA